MKYLVVIPARKGSKGIPNKNSKKLIGKPLIQYTIDAAKDIVDKEDICISTDSEKIVEISESLGISVPFTRPKELASDESGMHEVLIHAIKLYEESFNRTYDAVVLLQPTSPLRQKFHIEEAISLFDKSIDMVVSVKESSHNPYYNLFEEDSSGYLKKSKSLDIVRRQDAPKIWEYNGAVYVINIERLKKSKLHNLKKVVKYPMHSKYSYDLDTMEDWVLIEHLLSR